MLWSEVVGLGNASSPVVDPSETALYHNSLLALYCLSLLPLGFFFYFVCITEKLWGMMTAFGIQTGAALIVRLAYLTLSPADYRVIFDLQHGTALMMCLDFIPELLKLTSWVTILSYWRGLLATNSERREEAGGCCRGAQWMACGCVSMFVWLGAGIFVACVLSLRLSYDTARIMEGSYLFATSCVLGGVGGFVIIRFLIYFSKVMSATQTLRKDVTPFMRIFRMRVTYATSISAFVMVLYFAALFTLAQVNKELPAFVMFWRGLIIMDVGVTLLVLWLLAPRPTKMKPCCNDFRRRVNKMRIQNSRGVITSQGSASGSYRMLSGGHAIQDDFAGPSSP